MQHHCVLCGSCSDLSPHPAAFITDLVRQKYVRGPVVYPIIMEWDKEQVMPICRLCFHQLRRTSCGKTRRLLPMDATLLQTIVPGQSQQQDSRTRDRMCAALLVPGNSYSRSFEVIQTLLPMEESLKRWWELNLKTEFFAHKGTARVMRKLK